MQMDYKHIIEAALFSAGRPLSVKEIQDATGLEEVLVKESLKSLLSEYKNRDSAIEIAKVGEKFAMQVRPKFANYTTKLAQMDVPVKLLKTLALIAYHQPIKQSDLLGMLGPKVYDHVHEIQELGLVHAKEFGRTKLLTTTNRFSEYFGIDTTDKVKIKKWLAEKTGIKIEKMEKAIEEFENHK